MVFGYTTDVKLLELANLDRPVLRRVMVQAPGSYHHSVIVGAMVEARAEAIGANRCWPRSPPTTMTWANSRSRSISWKTRARGRTARKNGPVHVQPHPDLPCQGRVELARQNKLSNEIIDIIKQHHGTSLIAFFYQKAQISRLPGQADVNIEDFRYPGPKRRPAKPA
jgi:membrane-associated HD superfamily phosphohydrolase